MYLKALLVTAFTALALSSPVYAADAGHPSDAARSNAFQGGPPPHAGNADRGRRGPPAHVVPGRPHDRINDRINDRNIAQVPELGGASAGLALLLLGGLIALRRETRKPS